MTARERRMQATPSLSEVLSNVKVETVTFKPVTDGKCLVCSEVIPNNTKQKFCSRNCQYVYADKTKRTFEHTCEICGIEYYGYRDSRFCGTSCSNRSRKK
jgi:predicted nucleic acid-binding Zn ribbon protein